MISFRYHLVSIIAVFLALALGIVVGTTGLNGAILSDLRSNVKSQKNEIAKLRDQNSQLQKQANNADDFVSSYSKQVLAGALDKQAVLVIGAPGADGKIKSGIESAIAAGGGTVAGKIQLTSDYADPARGAEITGLATGPARPDGLTLPVTTDSATIGGALLAYVLSGSGTTQNISTVLAAFAAQNMLKVDGSDPKGAQLVVIVGSGSATKGDARTKAMPALISELNKAGVKTVVAGDGDSATEAGLIALVRNDSILPKAVSTVDDADTGLGQVSVILALDAAAAGAKSGQYGTGPNASALFPAPAATSK